MDLLPNHLSKGIYWKSVLHCEGSSPMVQIWVVCCERLRFYPKASYNIFLPYLMLSKNRNSFLFHPPVFSFVDFVKITLISTAFCKRYVMRCLNDALSLDGTLDVRARQKRTLFFAISFVAFLTQLWTAFRVWTDPRGRYIYCASHTLSTVATLAPVVLILCKYKLTTHTIVCCAYLSFLSIVGFDITARAIGQTTWPFFVLIIDLLLVMEVPACHSTGVVCFSLLYFVVMCLEEVFRFGILDMPGLLPQGERHEVIGSRTRCTVLPCPYSDAYVFQMNAVIVFVIDFIATRGFSRGLLKEQASMERTINTVQEIASLLAGYDVERVAELLAEHEGQLPEEMLEALRGLEENLRKYRPYLPAALFEVDEDGVQQPTVAPPGLDSETATIVFTDIRASTSIWEYAPEGMCAGLQIHNAVIREVMRMCGGYEVKTIGDAFMVAFASTCDGVAFGLRVQERLFEADWPASLLEEAPICSRQGSLWGGLTVRIGVNTGPVTVEQNTLTGRTDYFGHAVNVASRLESTCTPGAVAVPSDLWEAECGSCSAVVGVSEAVHLKGVSGSTLVCCVWPVSLGGRREVPLCESFSPRMKRKMSRSTCPSYASSADVLAVPLLSHCTRQLSGTVGVAQLAVGDVAENTAFAYMSLKLTTLTIALEQSGGSLVTLLGNCVCVGWNVSRSAPAHMENAIRFAQRMSVKSALNGAGLASGPVQHGDVGARKQRFVTVMGQIVRRSWTLCEEAVRDGVVCLYESPQGTTLPSALEDVLVQHKGSSYRVVVSDSQEHDTVL